MASKSNHDSEALDQDEVAFSAMGGTSVPPPTASTPAADGPTQRLKTIHRTFSNPRARISLVIVSVVLLFMVLFGVHRLLTSQQRQAESGPQAGASNLTSAAATNDVPGTSQNPGYNHLVATDNQQRFASAQNQGATMLPTLANPVVPATVLTLPAATPVAAPYAPSGPMATATGAPVVTQQEVVAQVPTGMQHNVDKQVDMFMGVWTPRAANLEFNYEGKMPPAATAATATTAGASAGTSSDQSATAQFVTAGSVLSGMLLTPINSDHPGPVLAEITQGRLAGARLLGSFVTENNRVAVTFDTLSMGGKSYSISAFAVSPSTASTALATSVNHHYLEKYGIMLAAAFVSGYGQAIEQQNATTAVTPLGGVIVSNSGLSNRQILMGALGNVGTTVSQEAQSNAQQIKPTVRVAGHHGAPVPIGVLFMHNF